MNSEKSGKIILKNTARELAQLAVFVALVIAAQLALSVVPGVEIVTLLFVAYAFVFGMRYGMLAATAFTLLRQLVFGFHPTVLILYMVYFNGLTAIFGALGKKVSNPLKHLWWLTIVACLCTVSFTLMDNIITSLWYRYAYKAARVYFLASLPVAFSQAVCTAVSVGGLFFPLQKVFRLIKRKTP